MSAAGELGARSHRTPGAPGLERAFDFLPEEGAYRLEPQGTVPSYVRGSYTLNGPCRFQVGGLRYRHWLDGDGMVSRLHFGPEGIDFANRFVRGTKWRDEEEAGGPLYRTFGTTFPGDRLKRGLGLESPLNVSVYNWNGTLLAFGEQGLPWELDPVTLETLGEFTFGGRLNAISPVSAHPHCDAASGEMFNFGISFSPRQPSLTVYRFGADRELRFRRRLPLEWPASVHDFMLGARHLVFYLSPYLLDVEAVMKGGSSLMDALAWRPELGSRLLILDRETGEPQLTVALPGRYCLHLINSFEEDGLLFLDAVELERPVYDQYQVLPELFLDAPAGRPRRHVVDLVEGRLLEDHPESGEIRYDNCPDFPAIDPRYLQHRYRDLWLLGIAEAAAPGLARPGLARPGLARPGRKFFDQLAHLRWEGREEPQVWQAPAFRYLGGEPIFLGDPENLERGCVICQEFDAERRQSAFLLFDAFAVEQGPIARLPLRSPLPLCFHASWHPEV